jgi:lysophospholipase L1-like esterase
MSSRKYRMRLDEEEHRLIRDHRALEQECEQTGIPLQDVNHYWYKGKNFSLHVKNPGTSIEDMRDGVIQEMNKYSPTYTEIKREKAKDNHCLVLDPADIHIGKLATAFETGEDYNAQIAVKRVLEGVQGILDKSSGFNIDKIVLIGGNDVLHIDTPKRTTTAGTPQDTDGMWYDNFLTAKKLYVDILEQLASIADVVFIYNPSNHDYTNGFFLADVIQSWFRNHPNISFDCSIAHRKYFQYHKNLIGTTHGDGAKPQELPLLMAQEAPAQWASTKHRYIYTHHVHHKNAKDFVGVTVESLRSPSAADSWHHRNGYQHNPKAVEGFIHHPEHGQVARLTHIF